MPFHNKIVHDIAGHTLYREKLFSKKKKKKKKKKINKKINKKLKTWYPKIYIYYSYSNLIFYCFYCVLTKKKIKKFNITNIIFNNLFLVILIE